MPVAIKSSRKKKRKKQVFDKRLNGVKQLISIFKMERIVYAAVTFLSFLILICSIIYQISKGTGDFITYSMQFGSTGIISFTSIRVLNRFFRGNWLKIS